MDDPMWETKTIIIDKTQPNQGFGIAISGGVDNPHFKTGSTAIIVSDIVPGSPSDGLLKVNDQVLFVNNNNMNRATHDDAVQALREAGMQARMVIRRMQTTPSPRPPMPQQVADSIPKDASTPKESNTPLAGKRAQRAPEQEPQKPDIKVEMNGHSEVLVEDMGDNKFKVTLQRGGRGYGFAMGQLFYVRELAPNGPAMNCGEIQPGDRVLEINSKPLDKVKTLSEAIELVLGSTNQISLLLEKSAVKPVPATRTPKLKKKEIKEPQPIEPVKAEEVRTEPPVKDSEPLIAEKAPAELQAEPQIPKNEMETTWKSPNSAKDPEKVDLNVTKDSWDGLSPGETKPAPVEPVVQSRVVDSYASKLEKQRLDQIKNRRLSMGHEGHYITFHKSGNLGIQVAGGNAVGIFAAAVKGKSAAAKAGLKQGDLILEANEIDFRQITREEAVLILLALGEEVSLFVVPQKTEFERVKSQLGDNFFVRANFDHIDKSSNNELTFRKGEIFNVRDTMYQGLIGAWQAKRVGKKGQLLDQGILPNKSRAEQLAIAQNMEEKTRPKISAKLQRRGSLGSTLRSSLRRSKFMFTSQDKLDDQSFNEVNFQIPAYERVVLRVADFMRPIVILGPCADLARMMLVDEMPDRFAFPLQSDSFGQKSRTLPRSGSGETDKSYGESVKFSSIRQVVQENKHCLLDLTPDGIEKLMFFQMCPIVILLKTVSKVAGKAMRASLVDQLKRSPTGAIDITEDPLTRKHVKKIHSLTKRLEEFYPHVFTAKLNTHIAGSTPNNREWYVKMKEIIFRQQSEMAWMPEEKPDEAMMEDFEIRRPNYLSYISGGESDTEAESVIDEPKRFEDFEESQVESPPRSPAQSRYSTRPAVDDVFNQSTLSEVEANPPQRVEDQSTAHVYDEPPRDDRPPYSSRNVYDTPYEERREVTEQVTVETRTTVESSLPQDAAPAGPEKREYDQDLPVLKDPDYKLPPGYQGKPDEKKPINSIKVYPTGLSAGDARQALRRTEVVKSETNEEDEAAQEIKQKGDSLRRVPKDDNPVLREMDERADVKVSDLWRLEKEAENEGPPPSRPPAPRNYIVDANNRNRRQFVANSSYRPTPQYAEVKRVSKPTPSRDPVEEQVTASQYNAEEAIPNGPSDIDKRGPPDYRRAPPERYETREPSTQYRPPPSRNERPQAPQGYREPPPARDYRNIGPRRFEPPQPQSSYRDPPPARDNRDMEPGRSEPPQPQRNYRDPPPSRDYRDMEPGKSEPPQPQRNYRDPPPARDNRDMEPGRSEPPQPQRNYRDPPPSRDYRDMEPGRSEPPQPQRNYRDPPPSRDYRDMGPGRSEPPQPQSNYRDAPSQRYDRPPPKSSYRDPPQSSREPPPVREKPATYQNYGGRPDANRQSGRDQPRRDGPPYRDYSTGPILPKQPPKSEPQYQDEPKVIATARGIFDHRGGLLESTETGVSVYVPAGALPEGKKQEIYFKVCQDNKYIPPLDSDGGETLLSPLVMCGPHGLSFKKPIELRLPHKGNSGDGMTFSLKSSDSPVGDPSKWKNINLGGRDLDASRAYQVTDDTVSVLVDHF